MYTTKNYATENRNKINSVQENFYGIILKRK